MPTLFSHIYSFPQYWNVSKCETGCHLVKGITFKVTELICLFYLERYSQNEVGNIGILVL